MHEQLLDVADKLLTLGLDLRRRQEQAHQLLAFFAIREGDPERALARLEQRQADASARAGWRDQRSRRRAIGAARLAHTDRALGLRHRSRPPLASSAGSHVDE